jgi:hypothetical protein
METNRIKKAIAILLAVCFLVSLTATAVSAFDSKKTAGKTTATFLKAPVAAFSSTPSGSSSNE